MSTIGEIDVLVSANTRDFNSKMDRVERRAKSTAEAVQSPFERIGETAQRALAPIVAVGAAIQGVELLAKGATIATDLFTALGDEGDEANEAIKRIDATIRSLPLGIGPAIGSITDLGKAITGVAEAERQLAKEQQALTESANFEKQIASLERGLALAEATTAEGRARIQIQQEFNKLVEQSASAPNESQRQRVLEIAEQQRAARLSALNRQLDQQRIKEKEQMEAESARKIAQMEREEQRKKQDRENRIMRRREQSNRQAQENIRNNFSAISEAFKNVFSQASILVSGAGSSGASVESPAARALGRSNEILSEIKRIQEEQLTQLQGIVGA